MRFDVTVALASLIALSSCTKDEPGDPWVPEVVVSVEDQPGHCRVQSVEVQCDAVATYLREQMKLPTTAPIQVSCVPITIARCDMQTVLGQLTASGYDNNMGVLAVDSHRP